MKLTPTELAYVRSQGLYVTEKCDACGKLLNQSFRYTITGKPEVYCSALCRDRAFFGESYRVRNAGRQEAQKCAYCGGQISGRKRDSMFCSDRCRKANSRRMRQSPRSGNIADSTLMLSTACGGEKRG